MCVSVGICIYNVSVTICFVLPILSADLGGRNSTYLIRAFAILFVCLTSVLILYIPKLRAIRVRKPGSKGVAYGMQELPGGPSKLNTHMDEDDTDTPQRGATQAHVGSVEMQQMPVEGLTQNRPSPPRQPARAHPRVLPKTDLQSAPSATPLAVPDRAADVSLAVSPEAAAADAPTAEHLTSMPGIVHEEK